VNKRDSFITVPSWAVPVKGEKRPEWWDDAALLVSLGLLAFRQAYTSAKGLRGPAARQSKARQTFHVSYPRLAKAVRVSASTAERRVKLFIRLGVLDLVKRGGPGRENEYRLHENKLYELLVSDGVSETAHGVTETPPSLPADGIWRQADDPVRSEVRGEKRERNGEQSVAIFNNSNDKDKQPTEEQVLKEHRAYVGLVSGDCRAPAGVRRSLAAKLRVSEEEAGALLNGASHGK